MAISGWVQPRPNQNDLLGICMTRPDLFGAPLDAFLKSASQHLVSNTALGNDLPDEATASP